MTLDNHYEMRFGVSMLGAVNTVYMYAATKVIGIKLIL